MLSLDPINNIRGIVSKSPGQDSQVRHLAAGLLGKVEALLAGDEEDSDYPQLRLQNALSKVGLVSTCDTRRVALTPPA